jgi:small subunit ribosomal protein S2
MAEETKIEHLLEVGAHFGHLRSKWNPNMAPYIFMERNGIHIVDLNKTQRKLEEACNAAHSLAASGKKIMYVATKKQAKDIVTEQAKRVNMPYVTQRWLGGMLTNFATVRKSIKKMSNIDQMFNDGTTDKMAKRERLALQREREKLESVLGGITDLNRPPAAVFIVDIVKEHIAMAEANKLEMTSFAITDTNANPENPTFPVPANDDASKSIALITEKFTDAVEAGLREREEQKKAKEKEKAEAEAKKADQEGEASEEADTGKEQSE